MSRRSWRSSSALGVLRFGLALIVLAAAAAFAPLAMASSPDPTSAAVGDPRSSGQGPGLVGDPAAAVALVVLIGAASVAITVTYLRFTGRSAAARGGVDVA